MILDKSQLTTMSTLSGVFEAEKLSVIEFKFSQIEPKIDNLDHRLSEIEKLLGWLKIIGGGVKRDRTISNR